MSNLDDYIKDLLPEEQIALLYYAEEGNVLDAANRAKITEERLKEIIKRIQQFPKEEPEEQELFIKNKK